MSYRRTSPGNSLAFVLVLLGFGFTGLPGRATDSIDDLTGPWQLLVDDHLVAAKTNVTRAYHPFQKYAGNPVLTANTAWEQLLNIYGTVLPAEDRTGYRMWYQGYLTNDPCNAQSRQLYATSTDGINWAKPPLYQYAWCGSFSNNFHRPGFMYSVMHTPHDPDPAKQYKYMTFSGGGWSAGWSSNGINFIPHPGNPVTSGSDSGQAHWDPHTQQYRLYAKVGWTDTNGLARRAVALTTTTNFMDWPASGQLVLHPDAIDDRWSSNIIQRTHFYGVSVFSYETMYLGFLWIHRATNLVADPPIYAGYQIGPIFVELVSSRDGVTWTRQEGDRPPILPLGPGGSWDAGMIFTPRAPIVEGDTVKLWYGGFRNVHDTPFRQQRGAIGYATLRKDGFASLNAGATTGAILTKAFGNAGGPLLVNYKTNAPGGWLKVEVLDGEENVLPGYSEADCVPLTGNSVTGAVTWVEHTELPADQPYLRLRFILENAALYSFMAGSNAALVDMPPRLGYLRIGNDAVLSWPANADGFSLEYATNMPPLDWMPALPAPQIVDGRYFVTNAVTDGERYYRLRKP